MKKQGFTLQELLISLAIVGVVAAMTVPAIMGIMPDETKVKYMKAYNALTSITNDLLSDNTIYWTEYVEIKDANGKVTNVVQNCNGGLDCFSTSSIDDFYVQLKNSHPEFYDLAHKILSANSDPANGILEDWPGNAEIKYPLFVASRMNLQSDITYNKNNHSCEFTTTDGTNWTITHINNPRGAYTVRIDVNPDIDASNMLTKEALKDGLNVNDVDTFEFEVSSTGSVRATDALGRTFLKTPTDMHRKKEDRLNAIDHAKEDPTDQDD